MACPKECWWLILEICIPVFGLSHRDRLPRSSSLPVPSPGSRATSLSLLPLLPLLCQENLGQAPLYCHLSKEHDVPLQTIVALEQGGQVGPALANGGAAADRPRVLGGTLSGSPSWPLSEKLLRTCIIVAASDSLSADWKKTLAVPGFSSGLSCDEVQPGKLSV